MEKSYISVYSGILVTVCLSSENNKWILMKFGTGKE